MVNGGTPPEVHFGLAYLASGDGDPMITSLGWRVLASALLS